MRGRKPKPSYLVALDGGASHSRAPRDEEPKPDGDLREPPAELSATQQKIWRYAIANAPRGMLKCIDHSVFKVWVVAEDTLERARSEVSRLGLIVRTKGGVPMQNPYLPIQNKQAAIVMKAAAELGFSPTARPRVKVPKSSKGQKDPFGKLRSIDD